jgi:arylsulfatase A-like enzyme
MQRHLLNVGYADHALGMILDELDAAGLFDEAMIVVVSDHGISIREDVENQRGLDEDSIGEIAAVPMLVKVPGVVGGKIDDRRALTIDIVPTVADIMGVDLPWDPEGTSLLGPDPARESTSTKTKADPVTYGADGAEVLAVAARLDGDFPSADVFDILPAGAPDLLGDEFDQESLERSPLVFQRRHADDFRDVVRSEDDIAVSVAWRVRGDAAGDEIVAVAVNGKVAAVSRAFTKDDLLYVQAMIPPDALRDGDNDIGLAVWSGGELLSVEAVR